MAHLATLLAFHYIFLSAFARLMSPLVALKAELGVAFKAVMGVLATKDAIHTAALIGTLACHMTELLAVSALDGWVELGVVAGCLVLHAREKVIVAHLIIIFVLNQWHLFHLSFLFHLVFFVWVDVAPEVHITLDRTARCDQVGISFGAHSRYVVVAIITLAH